MKRFFVLLFMLASIGSMEAFEVIDSLLPTFPCRNDMTSKAKKHYQFRTDTPQGLSIESSTATGLSLHYSINEMGIADIDQGNVKGQEIILKGQFAPNAEGRPNLPVVNRYVAVPRGATVSMQVQENASTLLTGIDLLPAMSPQSELAEGMPQLRWDADRKHRAIDTHSDTQPRCGPPQRDAVPLQSREEDVGGDLRHRH